MISLLLFSYMFLKIVFISQEKDDANFKLMSERIKAKSVQKLLTEEKQLFQAEISAIIAERDKYDNLIIMLWS